MTQPRSDSFAAGLDDDVVGALVGLRDLLTAGGGRALDLIHSGQSHDEAAWAGAGVTRLDALVRSGLLERDAAGNIRARLRLGPSAGFWIVHDHPRSRDDPVMGVGMMSMALSAFVPRREGGVLLDVGTGQGFLALLAAGHAGRVIATDVDPRALGCARLTAAMNGVRGIEWRLGSLLEPASDLAGSCDLVVSNPPQLVSPLHALTDGGAACAGDGFVEGLVRGAPRMLREGGTFACTAIWGDHGAWDARPRAWVSGSGCDAWIVRLRRDGVEAYAEMWRGAIAERRGGDMSQAGLERWLEHTRSRGETAVATALIFMRRRTGQNWVHAEPATLVGVAEGATPESVLLLDRVMEGRTLLAERGEPALLAARLVRVEGLARVFRSTRPEQASDGWQPGPEGWPMVRHRGGLAMETPETPLVRAMLGAVDGHRSGEEVVRLTARSAAGERPVDVLRRLVERGMVGVASPGRANSADGLDRAQ